MSHHCFLRLLLVCLTHSVVGCFPGLSFGDIAGNEPKIKLQALEVFNIADSSIQKPIKGTLLNNLVQFNSKYQWPRVNSAPYSQKSDGNAKNPSFRLTEPKDPAYVMNYQNKILSSSRNNPVDLSSVKYNKGHDAKTSYAFQTVQQELNPFTGSQWSSSDTNLGLRLVKIEGPVDRMHAGNVYRSETFGYQPISKSEMHSGSQQPLRLNEPYLREDISVQPAHAERISSNYMSRSSNANHNMRFKSDANAMFDQSNQNGPRRVMPIIEDLSFLEANQQVHKSSPHVFSAGTAALSQTSLGNVRDSSLSKIPTVPRLIPLVAKRPNSNRGDLIFPLKKLVMFSSEPDQMKHSDSRRVTIPQANPQNSLEYGNTKSYTNSYTLKDIQLTSAQNGYQNIGQSYQDVEPIQTRHTQKYDEVASGLSVDIPSTTNGVLSYKQFLSDENNIRSQLSALSKPSMQGTYLTSQIQFPKNTVLFLERDKSVNLPDITNDSLMKTSQHSTRHRTDLNPSGQSITHSLFVKKFPVPSLVPGNTIKSAYSVSPSASGTYKDSAVSTDQNHPYYISPKKPYAFKGFVPTSLQKSKVHFEQKPITNSLLNMQYVAAHPSTIQEPLISDQFKKMLFQFEDFKTSQDKQPDPDLTDSFNNRLQLSFKEGGSNMKYDVQGQAEARSGTESSNNGAAFLQKHLKKAYKELPLEEVQSETSKRWTSALHNLSQMPKVGSSISRFVGSNAHFSTTKFSNNHENPKSEIIQPIYKTPLINKAVAVVHPIHMYKYKEPEAPLNSAKEILGNRNPAEVTQSDISENAMRSSPTSSVVIGKLVEVTEKGKGSGENSYFQNSYSAPFTQSTSYRSTHLKSHKVNRFSTIYRSTIKQFDPINETNIDFYAIDASQSSSPTSSFVIGRLINTFNNASTKTNPKASSTKTALNSFKPFRFSDIAGSASFTNAKLHSAAITPKEVADVTRVSNHSDSTVMAEIIDSSSVISTLKIEDDVQSPVSFSVSEFLPTAAIDISMESRSSFTEEYSPSQTNSQLNHSKVDTHSFYEGTLMPDITTTSVSVTSDVDWLFLNL
ncbi:uncharacterized protein [Danio rerio]|uniref:Uncharacterized protein n=1 Tax=Danio rerio TaxID=7955 RepID=A0A8M9PPJ4_DANRE|nr:uncharacterized protein LOC110439932 [Danio rerio]|eukprot:XP_021333442.1 uncharacterized protein LOC110439932 [Danio rerio]